MADIDKGPMVELMVPMAIGDNGNSFVELIRFLDGQGIEFGLGVSEYYYPEQKAYVAVMLSELEAVIFKTRFDTATREQLVKRLEDYHQMWNEEKAAKEAVRTWRDRVKEFDWPHEVGTTFLLLTSIVGIVSIGSWLTGFPWGLVASFCVGGLTGMVSVFLGWRGLKRGIRKLKATFA